MKTGILVTAIFTSVTFAQTGLNDVEGYYAASEMYFDGGDYEMALSCAEHGIEIVPESPKLWYMKSVSLERLGRYDEAITAYEYTLTLDPGETEHIFTLDNLGNLYVAKGYVNKGIALYEKSIAIDDKNPVVYCNYAAALFILRFYKDSIKYAKKACKLDPDNGLYYFNLAQVYANVGKNGDAIKNYRKTIELSPDYIPAYENLALVLEVEHRYDEAIEIYDYLLADDPDNSSYIGSKALALILSDKIEEAYEIIKTCTAEDTWSYMAWSTVAFFKYFNNNDFPGAIEAAEKALEYSKGFIENMWEICILSYYCLGEYEDGCRFYDNNAPRPLSAFHVILYYVGSLNSSERATIDMEKLLPKHNESWPVPAAKFLIGEGTEDRMMAMTGGDKTKKGEAYMYIGYKKKYINDSEGAIIAFKEAQKRLKGDNDLLYTLVTEELERLEAQ